MSIEITLHHIPPNSISHSRALTRPRCAATKRRTNSFGGWPSTTRTRASLALRHTSRPGGAKRILRPKG